jgi:hypothetical protein
MKKLSAIGVGAFNGCGSGVKLTNDGPVGKSLKEIKGFAFGDCPNVIISDFSGVEKMGSDGYTYSCLNKCGINTQSKLNIILPNLDSSGKISSYLDGCLSGYAVGNIVSIRHANKENVSTEELGRLGLEIPETKEDLS